MADIYESTARPAMTPVRLRECMEAVCWGTATTAEVLGLRRQTVQRMLSGAYEIPADVASYMEAVGAWFSQNPFRRDMLVERDHRYLHGLRCAVDTIDRHTATKGSGQWGEGYRTARQDIRDAIQRLADKHASERESLHARIERLIPSEANMRERIACAVEGDPSYPDRFLSGDFPK